MSDTKLYRRATLTDSWDWWQIRNDPEALFWSNNKRKIRLEEHDAWFSRAIDPRQSCNLMVVHTGESIDAYGRIQYEVQAEVSLGVAPAQRGKGIGGGMLRELEKEAESVGVSRLVAYVHPANTPSMRVFMRQGYVLGGNPGFVRVEKIL